MKWVNFMKEKYIDIEKSIIKKYRKDIWSKFVKGIKNYELLAPDDSVAICISGGKDSFLLAKCMQELERHGMFNFDLKFIVMNPGYSSGTIREIKKNAKILNIPINIFKTDIFAVSTKLNENNPCYLCARMRRGYLYDYAKSLGCNKIALGHHFDDVIETILMSILYGAEFKTMMPKIKSKNFKGMELIRPLYLVSEDAIISWASYNKLIFLNCSCKFAEKEINSKRKEIKELIKELNINNKYIKSNIFKSTENVNLKTIISYKNNNKIFHFLDNYKEKSDK